jgi:rod shape determining protein RodA
MLKRNYASFDFFLALAVCGLAVFGIVMVGSATNINSPDASTRLYTMQKIWFAMGFVLMIAATLIDYHFISKFYILLYVVNLLLLVAVLFVGQETNGTNRWIRFGGEEASVGIQPSEFAKVFMILFLAKFLDAKKEHINNLLMLLLVLALVAVPAVLIEMQPSLSATLVVVFSSVIIIYQAGMHYRYILAVLLLVVPCAVFFYLDLLRTPHLLIDKILTDYQIGRIVDFLYPNEATNTAYQLRYSLRAIGSGLLHGKGLYNGVVAIPASYNDFIFALIGEEFGFVGCVSVMAVLLFIIFKCVITAHRAPDLLGRLIAVGVAAMLAFQTVAHICVDIGLLPNTGVPLPFVSYGGSSMWISMISIGLVLNVAITKQKSIFEV